MEHLLHTPGFTLDFVEYVVVDEADRLLSQVVKTKSSSKDLLFYFCFIALVGEADRLLSQVVKRCSKDPLLYYCLTVLLLCLRLDLHWILLSTLRFFLKKKPQTYQNWISALFEHTLTPPASVSKSDTQSGSKKRS